MDKKIHYTEGEVIKRFMVFSYDNWDAAGGIESLAGNFDLLDEALECFIREERYDNRVIFDRLEGREIDATKYGLKY